MIRTNKKRRVANESGPNTSSSSINSKKLCFEHNIDDSKNPFSHSAIDSPTTSSHLSSSPIKNLKYESTLEDSDQTPSQLKLNLQHRIESTSDEISNNGEDDDHPKNGTVGKVSPRLLHDFCKGLLDLDEQNEIKLDGKKGSANFEPLKKGLHLPVEQNIGDIQSSFRICYRTATKLNLIPLKDMLQLVSNYLASEKGIHEYPDFPKPPLSLYYRFCKKLGYGVEKIPENLYNRFKNVEDPLFIESKNEFDTDRLSYLNQLEKFYNTNRGILFPAQISFLEEKLRSTRKAVEEKNPKNKRENTTKEVKQKTEAQKTAFDFFKQTKKDKYSGINEELREQKLRKKFNKLNGEMLLIFENLAKNQ